MTEVHEAQFGYAKDLLEILHTVDRRASIYCGVIGLRPLLEHLPRRIDNMGRVLQYVELSCLGGANPKLWERYSNLSVSSVNQCIDDDRARSICIGIDILLEGLSNNREDHPGLSSLERAGEYFGGNVPEDFSDKVRRVNRQTFIGNLYPVFLAVQWKMQIVDRDDLNSAPPGVRVAWDYVVENRAAGRLRFPTCDFLSLISAHARATRLGLDWKDPVHRGLAERMQDSDDEKVKKLIGEPMERC